MAGTKVKTPEASGGRGPRENRCAVEAAMIRGQSVEHDWPAIIRNCRELGKALASARPTPEKLKAIDESENLAGLGAGLEAAMVKTHVGQRWSDVYHRLAIPGVPDDRMAVAMFARYLGVPEFGSAVLRLWNSFWSTITPIVQTPLEIPNLPEDEQREFESSIDGLEKVVAIFQGDSCEDAGAKPDSCNTQTSGKTPSSATSKTRPRGRRSEPFTHEEERALKAWKEGGHSTYAECARHLGGNWNANKLKSLVDRTRKRPKEKGGGQTPVK